MGVDVSIDCAGDAKAQEMCINSTRRNGKISFVGESGHLKLNVSDNLIRNGLTLYGIWHYNLNAVAKLFKVAEGSQTLINKLITHTFPLNRIDEAWELQISRKCGKVIIKPWL